MSPKYPRTPHLPYSPGGTSDDRRISSVEAFLCTPVVLTEKLDGSNVCLEKEACFARSHATAPNHPSFDAFKAFHASVKGQIGDGIQVFGEWVYAKHSISYSDLSAYFLTFGVRDLNKGLWASWEEVELWSETLGVPTVPVLAREPWLNREHKIRDLVETHSEMPSRLGGGPREGIVLRVAGEFKDEQFSTSVAKWVRKDHVQSDEHWKNQQIVRNALR